MFYNFFYELKNQGIPASLHEYLSLMDALNKQVVDRSLDHFYYLTKTIFVKEEAHLDRFDKIFGYFFQELQELPDDFFTSQIPNEWLGKNFLSGLSPEDRAAIERMGGLDALMERFRELMEEQKKAHSGGNKWIGTGGTSPFGAGGYNPEGFKVWNKGGGNKSAIKVWEKREFKNLDDQVELNTRNIKMALRNLRHFTREGLEEELDLDDTIKKTSHNAGMLDISLQATKKNRVKVLLLIDVGGSMDAHVKVCEKLFSSAKHEFKHLKYFYFHNCIYESIWKDNTFRYSKRMPTLDLINKYGKDYKVIIVGDAAMSPYEIFYSGGSIEHNNDVAGIKWLRLLKNHFSNLVWLNPLAEYSWDFYETTMFLREFTEDRMFPLTIDGMRRAMKCLKNKKLAYKKESWGDDKGR